MFDEAFPLAMAVLGGGSFSPASLFAGGEQGAWYDPSDFSTMFQDDLGTTPVTATGQTVGLIRDKSGRGNHASQATVGSRPTLQQETTGQYYLAFDGTDDSLSTAAIDFSVTDKISAWSGTNKLAIGNAFVFGTSTADGLVGSFGQAQDYHVGGKLSYWIAGSLNGGRATTFSFPVPGPTVSNVAFDIGASGATECAARVNGADVQNSTNPDAGTGNFGNYPLYIGRRGGTTLPFNGRLYSLILRGAASSAHQITLAERWVNSKTGAF